MVIFNNECLMKYKQIIYGSHYCFEKPIKGDEELHTHTNSSSIDNNSNM